MLADEHQRTVYHETIYTMPKGELHKDLIDYLRTNSKSMPHSRDESRKRRHIADVLSNNVARPQPATGLSLATGERSH